jgi:uncharacterized protein (TIGR00290 family)
MRVVAYCSGGKDGYTAYHKAIELDHDVAYLLTFVYAEPYFFHSFPIMELQSKALGTPQLKVRIKDPKNPYQEIFEVFARLKREEGIEAIVTGDIAGVMHRDFYEEICEKLGMDLVMPLWNPCWWETPLSGRFRILDEEISARIKSIFYSVNLDYFGEEWLGRKLDKACIKDLKALVDKHEIDACGEDGRGYHTMVIDSPFFKEAIEIGKFSKTRARVVRTNSSWLYMDVEEAFLRPKK